MPGGREVCTARATTWLRWRATPPARRLKAAATVLACCCNSCAVTGADRCADPANPLQRAGASEELTALAMGRFGGDVGGMQQCVWAAQAPFGELG